VKEKEAFWGLFWNVPFVGTIIQELRPSKNEASQSYE
jgi:hypothetical protein